MTPEEIAAKVFGCVSSDGTYLEFKDVEAANIIRAAIAEEREACARLADLIYDKSDRQKIAAAIRARGRK